MNKYALEVVDPALKIGGSCMFMNYSAIFEYWQMLSISLSYTNLDFIYNPKYFTAFVNPKPTSEYISKDNPLIITGGVDSVFTYDFNLNTRRMNDEMGFYSVQALKLDLMHDLAGVKREYLDQGIPVIFACDHYYFYEDYRQVVPDLLHYHTDSHRSVLVDVDLEQGKACLIDKFFGFKGWVSLENFWQAIDLPSVEEGYVSCWIIETSRDFPSTEEERIDHFLKKHIEYNLQEQVQFDGRKYFKGLKGLQLFVADLPEIFVELERQKGEYAPQFTTKLLTAPALQRDSYQNMLKYLLSHLQYPELKTIAPLVAESSRLWQTTDSMFDKCYLKGKNVTDDLERFQKVFRQIYEREAEILENLAYLAGQL